MRTPDTVKSLELDCTCVGISGIVWDKLMRGATRANNKKIDQLVKQHLPDLYEDLALDSYNPYNYYKTDTHLILVHSSIEYFIKYE